MRYVLSAKLNDSFRAVNLLLEKGVAVRRVPRADGFLAGDFIVAGGSKRGYCRGGKANRCRFHGAPGRGAGFGIRDSQAEDRDVSAIRWRQYGRRLDALMFEQFNVPFKSLMDAELKKGDLNASYDVIVLPADSIAAMTGERPQEGAGGGRGGGAGAGQDITPPEYRSGFGADGVKALQGFVREGGTLVTFGQAGDLPMQRFGLPLRNVVAGLAPKAFWAPGSTLRVRFDPRHPLAYGMPEEGLALFLAGCQAYEVTSTETSQDVEIYSTYVERDILQSGWLLGEEVIAKKAAAVAVKHGSGRVVLIGFRPQHRESDARHLQAGVQRAARCSSWRHAANDFRRATIRRVEPFGLILRRRRQLPAVDRGNGFRDRLPEPFARLGRLLDLYSVGATSGEPVDDVVRVVAVEWVRRAGDSNGDAGAAERAFDRRHDLPLERRRRRAADKHVGVDPWLVEAMESDRMPETPGRDGLQERKARSLIADAVMCQASRAPPPVLNPLHRRAG